MLRAELPALVTETEERLRREQPDVIARLDPALVREGIAVTHARFVAILEGAEEDDAVSRQVAFASAASGAGVPVEALLAGYRVGAQVGWSHVAAYVAERGIPAEAVMALATASLAYVDELTANSFEGFAREAAAAGGARACCTSTRRPSATASGACASASATRSTIPTPASSWRSRCAPWAPPVGDPQCGVTAGVARGSIGRSMGWGFVWLMLVLKIPIGLLLWLVWWAVRQTPDDDGAPPGGDGGSKVGDPSDPRHPRSPFPRDPRRRGPHGDAVLGAPPRTRTRSTRTRTRTH